MNIKKKHNTKQNKLKQYICIYRECMRCAISKVMAYRVNFFVSTIITLFGNLAFPLVTMLIYRSGSSFPGWNFYEVWLLQAIFTMANGLTGIVFHGVLWITMDHVREGSFEIVLLKPVSPLFYLVATTFDPESSGLFICGSVFYFVAACHLPVFSIIGILQSILLFLAGMAVMAGFSLFMAAISFKWVGNSRIPEIFDSIATFGKYPLNIFPGFIRLLATFLIPVGMIGYYPAQALLGRLNSVVWIAVLPCFLFAFTAVKIYGRMIKLYEGVGG